MKAQEKVPDLIKTEYCEVTSPPDIVTSVIILGKHGTIVYTPLTRSGSASEAWKVILEALRSGKQCLVLGRRGARRVVHRAVPKDAIMYESLTS